MSSVQRFVSLALACVVLLVSRTSFAHDLAIDRLHLWTDGAGALRGEIEFDPELTRRQDEPPSPAANERVLGFLRVNLRLEVDGKRLSPNFEVRELWVNGGATRGDLVMLESSLPRSARELRVFVPDAMKALVVSIRGASNQSEATHSTLVFGGRWSAPFRFGAPPPEDWRRGGPDQFQLDAGSDALLVDVPRLAEPAVASGESESRAGSPRPLSHAGSESPWRVGARYLVLGIEHIVPRGLDHVLFVAGLALACRRFKPLLLQLSAFTLAHSLTLALGALGLVVLPSHLIEPLIALSIAVVAAENLLRLGERKHRVLLVLAFGLLHGQGFASVLSELQLPKDSFLLSLVGFNLGVEIGQLFVVALVLLALRPIEDPAVLRKYAVVPASIAIAGVGLYLAAERLLG